MCPRPRWADFALTQQPAFGWSSPAVWAPGLAGLALFTAFVLGVVCGYKNKG